MVGSHSVKALHLYKVATALVSLGPANTFGDFHTAHRGKVNILWADAGTDEGFGAVRCS